MNNPKQALAGIKILDFSRVLAGPFCTMMLADVGAEVIKIERPNIGDETRAWGPPWADDGDDKLSAYYLSVNRNKYSVTLNLKSQQGQDIARQLAMQSDVIIENFKIGGMQSFGLDYESLKQEHPQLIYCSLTGYGQNGPYANRPGYDYVIQAQTGLMSITGPSDGDPHKVGVAISDVVTGLTAANAIQTALLHRERTGEGQYIDVALFDSQLSALVNIASNYLISGDTPPRLGNAHPNIVPYQTFAAQDGDFVVAVGNQRQFTALCEIINRPDLLNDSRFHTNDARVNHRQEMIAELAPIFKTNTVQFWVEKLLSMNIPSGEINNVGQAFELDQTQTRNMKQSITLSNGRDVDLVGPATKFSQTPATIRKPPPQLGEDTTDILQRWLGFDQTTIDHMKKEGTI